MHFVCSLYASLSAYIFSFSALRTRLFSFLYALYAVFFGVVFSHSMHSRFFDAYNAYSFLIVHPSDGTDGLRTRPQERVMVMVGMVADVVAESEASLGALSRAVEI